MDWIFFFGCGSWTFPWAFGSRLPEGLDRQRPWFALLAPPKAASPWVAVSADAPILDRALQAVPVAALSTAADQAMLACRRNRRSWWKRTLGPTPVSSMPVVFKHATCESGCSRWLPKIWEKSDNDAYERGNCPDPISPTYRVARQPYLHPPEAPLDKEFHYQTQVTQHLVEKEVPLVQ